MALALLAIPSLACQSDDDRAWERTNKADAPELWRYAETRGARHGAEAMRSVTVMYDRALHGRDGSFTPGSQQLAAMLAIVRDGTAPPSICLEPKHRYRLLADSVTWAFSQDGNFEYLAALVDEAASRAFGARLFQVRVPQSACSSEELTFILEAEPQAEGGYFATGREAKEKLTSFELDWSVALQVPGRAAPLHRIAGTAKPPARLPLPGPHWWPTWTPRTYNEPAPTRDPVAWERFVRQQDLLAEMAWAEYFELAQVLLADLGLPEPSSKVEPRSPVVRRADKAEKGSEPEVVLYRSPPQPAEAGARRK